MIRVVLSLFIALMLFQPALALTIEKVRVGQHEDKTRLVFELDEAQDFRAFVLDRPDRLVIDLPAFGWRVADIKSKSGSGIREVRHGHLSDGVSRIVLDMDRMIAIDKAFLLPARKGYQHRLVVDYKPVSAAQFEQERRKIFGTLNPQQVAQTVSFSAPAIAPPQPESKPQPPPFSSSDYKPLVIIDPGHGGVDPGAIGPGHIQEKNVVLALAKELRDQLVASGRYRVLLTREQDEFIRLHNRVKFARENGGDLFVSIHADSVDKPEVQGASIYTLSEKASDAQTAQLAARENQADLIAGIDLSVEDEEVAGILVDLAMRDTMNQSKFFANKLAGALRENGVKTLKSPHRSAGFAVLKAPDIPSILVEAGFVSNRQEANQLNTRAYREKVARSVFRSIDLYFEQVRKNERI